MKLPVWVWVVLVSLGLFIAVMIGLDLTGMIRGTQAGPVINGLVALGTIGVVVVALAEISTGREALELSQQAIAESARAGKAAQDAVTESVRARLDVQAPRVLALFLEVEQYPYLYRSMGRPRIRTARELFANIGNSPRIADGDKLHMDADEGLLWFVAYGMVINEGFVAATVSIQDSVEFVENDGRFNRWTDHPIEMPPQLTGDPEANEHLLLPAQAAMFRWAEGRMVSEWIAAAEHPQPPGPSGRMYNGFLIQDARGTAGVLEMLWGVVRGAPLTPSPGMRAAWELLHMRDDNTPRMVIEGLRSQRWYPALGDPAPEPPYQSERSNQQNG